MDEQSLIKAALTAREQAYAPYSRFTVGAALLCADGKVYVGANQENAAYAPSLCAERVAFARAVYDGCRDFTAIAVVGGAEGGAPSPLTPCGVCRQVMAEFCRADFLIISAASADDYAVYSLGELLPRAFLPAALTKE